MVDRNIQEEKSYLNNIFPIGFKECITFWANNEYGSIVDVLNDCVLRFVEYYRKPDTEDDDFEVLDIHHTTEDRLTCPIVAEGIVVFWLRKNKIEGIKAIFEGYFDFCLNAYEKAHENDDNAWERDLKKEFVFRYHIPNEKKLIKKSEALFEYVTENEQKRVKGIMDNYLKFARAKCKKLYPPNHPANRILEDTFFDAYRVGGPAYECMSWMRTEYNLPNTDSIWFEDGKTTKELLSGRWKERHERVIPEYVAEGYEDFDDRVLKYSNGGLMDEINENIKRCQTEEDRIRYIITLLQPFKEFAGAFNAKAQIDARKRCITEHEKWIKNWETMPDDAIDERTGNPIRPKDEILACKESIEEYKQDIEYWRTVQKDFYWFAQHGLGAGLDREYPQEVNDEMCRYLGRWWECMIFFARRLAALVLTYGIKLMDVQEKCEIYLTWHFEIFDYVDNKHITSTEHARRLLNEIEAKTLETTHVKDKKVKELTWEEEKQCFKDAVLSVMEEKRKNGDYFFEKPTHWIAVYRVAVDCGVMYDMGDPNEPQDKSKPQYTIFEKLAHELQFDDNSLIRVPFTKKTIDSIQKPNYVRYNAPYPWSKDGLTLTKSLNIYSELEDIYKLLKVKHRKLVCQAERSSD